MDLSKVPLFEALAKRMAWLSDRQAVLAQNVANADTPGYVAHDLRALDFHKLLSQTSSQVTLATTQPGHIAVKRNLLDSAGTETTSDSVNGGHVTLEQEMMKVSRTANDYALATSVYKSNLNLLKAVLGRGN